MEDIVKKLHPLERKVLPFLGECSTSGELASKAGMKGVEVVRALQWLSNKSLLEISKSEEEYFELGKNGKEYKEKGLPERRFLKALEKEEELNIKDIPGKAGISEQEVKVSLGQLKKNDLIELKKDEELFVSITDKGKKRLFDQTAEESLLRKKFPLKAGSLNKEEKEAVKSLKKRKDILEVSKKKTTNYKLTKDGEKLASMEIEGEYIEKLTPELIDSGEWKDKEFREYDVSVNVPRKNYGKKHFVNEAIEYVKRIWLDMGFEEMEGGMVQTAFWNMDSLFVPQDHPARDLQDTFYVEGKGKVDKDVYKRVSAVHEDGGDTGSKGWEYDFSREEAEQLLLRTHTTVLSAQTISKLKEEDLPAKFFSVGRNFRNESLDWKHLFEFHQVEGIVVDPDANFRNLVGYLKEFFKKMGFPDVRIRPGYFPYTEPSAEVDVWHPEREEWVELGGSGIFRPEVTKALIGKEVPVLAWGLGLERIITDYYGITDLRDIYSNDLEQLRKIKKFLK